MSMPIHLRVACCASIVWLPALSLAAQLHHVEYDPAAQRWTLRSGPVEYRLRRSGDGVAYDYFGPAGKPAWPAPGAASAAASEISGFVEGENIGPDDLRLVTVEPTDVDQELAFLYRHRRLPLEIEAFYSVKGDTGVITRRLTLTNRGERVIHIGSLPSPPGPIGRTSRRGKRPAVGGSLP